MPVIAHRPLSAADAPTCRLWPCSVRLLKCGRDVIAECAGNVRGSRDHVAEADDGAMARRTSAISSLVAPAGSAREVVHSMLLADEAMATETPTRSRAATRADPRSRWLAAAGSGCPCRGYRVTNAAVRGERINGRREEHASQAVGQQEEGSRFGLLLVLLVASYLLSAFTTSRWIVAVQVVVAAAVAILGARNATVSPREARLLVMAVLVGSAVMLAIAPISEPARGVASLWVALILLFTAVVIVHRILVMPTVTLDSIYGAVSAYLLLGLMFAAIFAAIDHLGGGHFFANSQPANPETFQYFSFTTLTTLGYGDFTAAGAGGRAVAILEALTGQIFLATLIARLVSAFRGSSERQR